MTNNGGNPVNYYVNDVLYTTQSGDSVTFTNTNTMPADYIFTVRFDNGGGVTKSYDSPATTRTSASKLMITVTSTSTTTTLTDHARNATPTWRGTTPPVPTTPQGRPEHVP